ncbi:EAL domain-containing protein (putative c-di-GMP-specific phosphodiesterase class I) [Aminobacter aminovorans]|uniref:Predicted signal transduction protein containing sensor and EAL domains n=1 Tax=Aminobacter aminovorans TaxID=83263 RepID=A0A380WL09_AMIAI|nr:EAL domain-containing protein [Aminobacter aminovorans]TCS29139.1 EAL domain-containing protein (putative c-di-GMP-specific phosphodiesterase class I) [Aminobacter aminovorans]SUU88992.1 Predicted signal transduction protein containing sensor and EAL domains [Aminobacter aminovorans]
MSDAVFGFGELPPDLVARIAADEIGLEFGVHGEFRLRCAIQPIFRHEDGRLTPVAAEAQVVPYREGRPAAIGEFLAEVAVEERAIVGRVWAVLPLANVHNMGLKGIAVLFRQDIEGQALALDDLDFMVRRLKGEGFEASQLICEIGGDEQLACALRALGMRVAIGHHGSAEPDGDAVKRVLPDIVRLDRASFERFCADAATGRLLRPVVSELKTLGAEVLVEGIDNENRLEIALGAGVELLQGDLLEPAKLVGSIFAEGPRDASQYRRGQCVVVPLFG